MFIALCSVSVAQKAVVEVGLDEEPKVTTVVYQPQFADKALLFFSSDLVWTCRYENEDEYSHKYNEADFSKVKNCICNKETYQLVPTGEALFGVYEGYTYQPIEKAAMGDLVSKNDSMMTYSEFSDDGGIKKTVDFKYNLNNVVRVDSVYSQNANCELELTIKKGVKFTKVQ